MNTLTARELSKVLKLPLGAIYRYVRLKKIPHMKIGKQVRFEEDKVLESLKRDS